MRVVLHGRSSYDQGGGKAIIEEAADIVGQERGRPGTLCSGFGRPPTGTIRSIAARARETGARSAGGISVPTRRRSLLRRLGGQGAQSNRRRDVVEVPARRSIRPANRTWSVARTMICTRFLCVVGPRRWGSM